MSRPYTPTNSGKILVIQKTLSASDIINHKSQKNKTLPELDDMVAFTDDDNIFISDTSVSESLSTLYDSDTTEEYIDEDLPDRNPQDFNFQEVLNNENNLTLLIEIYKKYIGSECDFLHFLMDNYTDQEDLGINTWTWRIWGKIESHTFNDILVETINTWNDYCDNDQSSSKYQLHITRDEDYSYDISIYDYSGEGNFFSYIDGSPICIYSISVSQEEAYELIDMAYYNNNPICNSFDMKL